MKHLPYERPELVEIGDADKLTLGCTPCNADSCNCAKCNGSSSPCLYPKQQQREA